jgi:hypothetical protein
MKTKLTYLVLATVMMSSFVSAQSFNLLTASSSDKVAQSKYFTVSAQQISLFASSSMQQPTQVTTANKIIAERTVKATSVGKENTATVFSLEQNYPNPFNGSTVIRYSLQTASNVSITVYDMTGREVTTLVNENMNEGTHSVTFSNQTVASGTYFYKLVSVDNNGSVNSVAKKMIVMK